MTTKSVQCRKKKIHRVVKTFNSLHSYPPAHPFFSPRSCMVKCLTFWMQWRWSTVSNWRRYRRRIKRDSGSWASCRDAETSSECYWARLSWIKSIKPQVHIFKLFFSPPVRASERHQQEDERRSLTRRGRGRPRKRKQLTTPTKVESRPGKWVNVTENWFWEMKNALVLTSVKKKIFFFTSTQVVE